MYSQSIVLSSGEISRQPSGKRRLAADLYLSRTSAVHHKTAVFHSSCDPACVAPVIRRSLYLQASLGFRSFDFSLFGRSKKSSGIDQIVRRRRFDIHIYRHIVNLRITGKPCQSSYIKRPVVFFRQDASFQLQIRYGSFQITEETAVSKAGRRFFRTQRKPADLIACAVKRAGKWMLLTAANRNRPLHIRHVDIAS